MILILVLTIFFLNVLYLVILRIFEDKIGGEFEGDDFFDASRLSRRLKYVMGLKDVPKDLRNARFLLILARLVLCLSSSLLVMLLMFIFFE